MCPGRRQGSRRRHLRCEYGSVLWEHASDWWGRVCVQSLVHNSVLGA